VAKQKTFHPSALSAHEKVLPNAADTPLLQLDIDSFVHSPYYSAWPTKALVARDSRQSSSARQSNITAARNNKTERQE
jgi:hypothetical protein